MTTMLTWKGHDYLKATDLSVYQVAEKVAASKTAAKNTIYIFFRNAAKGNLKRVDLDVLNAILSAIHDLSGNTVQASDLLEWSED